MHTYAHAHTHSKSHVVYFVFSTSSPHGLSVQEYLQTPGWRQRWRDYPRLQSAGSWPLGTFHGSHRRNLHLKPEKNSKERALAVKIFNPQQKICYKYDYELAKRAHVCHANAKILIKLPFGNYYPYDDYHYFWLLPL